MQPQCQRLSARNHVGEGRREPLNDQRTTASHGQAYVTIELVAAKRATNHNGAHVGKQLIAKAMVLNGLLDLGSLKHDRALAEAPAEHEGDAPVTVRRPEVREVREAVNEDAMEITVRASLHKNHGNMSAAERELGVTRSWLRAFMKRRGIEP